MTKEYGDLDLLRLLDTREAWEKYRSFVVKEALLQETWILVEALDQYYTNHPITTEVDWNTFRLSFLTTHAAKLGSSKTGHIAAIIDALIAAPAHTEATQVIAAFYVKMNHATRIRETVDQVIAGKDLDLEGEIETSLRELNREAGLVSTTNVGDVFAENDMAIVMEKLSRTDGLEWRLEDLNRSVGPIKGGDLVCVAATPNVGKTRFIASEVTYFANQLKEEDRRILIFNNEETAEAINVALYSAALDLSDVDIRRDVPRNAVRYDKAVGKDSIRIVQCSGWGTWEAEKVIKQWEPTIVVYNQLYKFRGGGRNATEAEQFRQRFQWSREVASKYDVASIAVHQAGALAAGEKWLTQEMLYGSKTGIAGECDVIIGIGKTYVEAEKNLRYISIARNKLPSGPRTMPEHREDSHFTVKFDAARSRYDTIEFI
jgi:replicative DNA helicase